MRTLALIKPSTCGTVAAALLLLGGCGGDPPSTPDFTTGTTSGSTGTPTPADSSSGSSTSGLDSSTSDGDTTTGSSSDDGSDSSGTTGPGIIDPGCPECTVLADGLEGGRGINLHGDYVYFTDQTAGTVNRVPKAGGEVEELHDLQDEPYDVVANDDHVFWTTFVDGGSVWRANLPSGPPIALSADGYPRMMQLVGDYVYWCAFDDIEGRVRRVLATGIANPPETLATVGAGVADLVVVGDVVHFTAHEPPEMEGMAPPGVVYTASALMPTDFVDLGVLGPDQSEPWGIAASNDTVYWVNGLGNPDDQPQSVVSTSSMPGAPLDVLALDQVAPWGIAVDDQYVYWTDYTRVKAVPLAGGEEIELAQMQVIARTIVLDTDDVYWITRERVLRRPKP